MKDHNYSLESVQQPDSESITPQADAVLDRFWPPRESKFVFMAERYLAFLKRQWWIVAVCVLIFLVLGVVYLCCWPVSYAATARMWVAGRISLQDGAVLEEQPMTFEETQAGLLESETLRHRALERLRKTRGMELLPGPDDEHAPFKVRVLQLRNGGVLELLGKGPTPESVKAFLNDLMDEFQLYKNETRVAASGDTFASLQGDIAKQQAQLKNEQDKLTAYGREYNVTVQEQQAQGASAYLSELLAEFSRLNIQFQSLENILKEAQLPLISQSNLFALEPALAQMNQSGSSTINFNEYLAVQEELQKLKLTRAQLAENLRPKHPRMVKLDGEIMRDEKLVAYFRQANRDQLDALQRNLKVRMDIMQQTINAWEGKVGQASDRIAEFQQLKSNVERAQSVETHLRDLLQGASVGLNLNRQTVVVLDHPSHVTRSKLPSFVVLPLTILVGACLGAVLILMIQRFSDVVTSADEVRWRFDEWVVGQVPNMANGKKPCRLGLIDGDGDKLGFGESFRGLRSALLFGTQASQQKKVLLVTSATPNEGKSTVAANLATVLALAGSRVLLIDGDLRCGRLDHFFGMHSTAGLSELLAGGGSPESFIVPTPMLNLFLLPRGTQKFESELFLRSSFDELLAYARRNFDYIVMDSIPVFAADDTANAAPKTDGVLFVIRGSFVGAGTVRRALEELYTRNVPVLGLVLNRANSTSRSYNYKYDQYYAHRNLTVSVDPPHKVDPPEPVDDAVR